MQTIWRALVWREWHEHKWKLVSLSAVMLSLQAAAIWGDPQMVTLVGETAALCGIAPLALFVGMGTAAGERSAGTLAFGRSLPAKRWQLTAIKAAAGMSTLLLSVFIAFLAPLVWLAVLEQFGSINAPQGVFKGLSPFEMLFLGALTASGLAASCYAWTLACGVNKPTETRAGLSAAAVLMGALALKVLALQLQVSDIAAQATTAAPRGILVLVRGCDEAGPLGFLSLFDPKGSPGRVVSLQLMSCAALFGWFLFRYGQSSPFEKRSAAEALPARGNKRPLPPQTIRPGRRTELAAIAWKQSREALPFCLIGALLIAGIALWLQFANMSNDPFPEKLTAASVAAGMMIAVLIGIGGFVGELQDRSLDFWRSRPIKPALWFWTKFATGLLAATILLAAPVVCTSVGGGPLGWIVLLVALPWLAIVYSTAVCLTCWVRHSFYAGVLSFALNCFLVALSLGSKWFSAASYQVVIDRTYTLAPGDWLLHVYLPYLGCTGLVAIAAALAGWLAVKRDLGPHRFSAAGAALHPLN